MSLSKISFKNLLVHAYQWKFVYCLFMVSIQLIKNDFLMMYNRETKNSKYISKQSELYY